MLTLRSYLFNAAWYLNIILNMIFQAPLLAFTDRQGAQKIPKRWTSITHSLHRWIVGTRVEVIGQENMLNDGCIVACKHQSHWEFYAIDSLVKDSAFILKQELMRIPVFGWYITRLGHIPIRRGDKGRAMRKMIKNARECIEDNRQIIIFPEGTRKLPDDPPDYRYGVTRMYLDLDCPVVPVAQNSGLYWPRHSSLRYPGTIRVKILEPIMPGLSAKEFSAELEKRIEQGLDELYLLASKDKVKPPMNEAVLARAADAEKRLKESAQE